MDYIKLPDINTSYQLGNTVNTSVLSRNNSQILTPRAEAELNNSLVHNNSIDVMSPVKSIKHGRNKTVDQQTRFQTQQPSYGASVSVMEVVKSQSKKVTPWGLDSYKTPKNDFHNIRTPSAMMIKNDVPDFLTQLQNKKKEIPSPDKYSKLGSMILNKKSSLPKLPRVSVIDELAKRNKSVPAVGQYETEVKRRIIGNYKYNQDKGSFITDAIAVGVASPAPYNVTDLEKYKFRTNKIANAKSKRSLLDKIVKNDDPSPGTYDSFDAYVKTQRKRNNIVLPKAKGQNMTDVMTRQKKWVPSVGQYDVTKALDKISKGTKKSYK